MLRCRTGEQAGRKKMERESMSSLVLAYREGSLGIIYLWIMRRETGTDKRREAAACYSEQGKRVSKCERVQVFGQGLGKQPRLTLTALCARPILGNSA